MDQIATFLQMGKHAAFVWPAYAIVAVVMAWFLVAALRRLRARAAALAVLEAETGGRRARRGSKSP